MILLKRYLLLLLSSSIFHSLHSSTDVIQNIVEDDRISVVSCDSGWQVETNRVFNGENAAKAPHVNNYQSTSFTISLSGPSVLAFEALVQVGHSFNSRRLEVIIDNTVTTIASLNTTWVNTKVDIPEGEHTVRFVYTNDSFFDNYDTVFVDGIRIEDPIVIKHPISREIENDLIDLKSYENGWITDYNYVFDSESSLRVPVLEEGQSISFELGIEGPVELVFETYLRHDDSLNSRRLDIFIDDVKYGDAPLLHRNWSTARAEIPSGIHSVRIRFSMLNVFAFATGDYVYLDNFRLEDPTPLSIDFDSKDNVIFQGNWFNPSVSSAGFLHVPTYTLTRVEDGANVDLVGNVAPMQNLGPGTYLFRAEVTSPIGSISDERIYKVIEYPEDSNPSSISSWPEHDNMDVQFMAGDENYLLCVGDPGGCSVFDISNNTLKFIETYSRNIFWTDVELVDSNTVVLLSQSPALIEIRALDNEGHIIANSGDQSTYSAQDLSADQTVAFEGEFDYMKCYGKLLLVATKSSSSGYVYAFTINSDNTANFLYRINGEASDISLDNEVLFINSLESNTIEAYTDIYSANPKLSFRIDPLEIARADLNDQYQKDYYGDASIIANNGLLHVIGNNKWTVYEIVGGAQAFPVREFYHYDSYSNRTDMQALDSQHVMVHGDIWYVSKNEQHRTMSWSMIPMISVSTGKIAGFDNLGNNLVLSSYGEGSANAFLDIIPMYFFKTELHLHGDYIFLVERGRGLRLLQIDSSGINTVDYISIEGVLFSYSYGNRIALLARGIIYIYDLSDNGSLSLKLEKVIYTDLSQIFSDTFSVGSNNEHLRITKPSYPESYHHLFDLRKITYKYLEDDNTPHPPSSSASKNIGSIQVNSGITRNNVVNTSESRTFTMLDYYEEHGVFPDAIDINANYLVTWDEERGLSVVEHELQSFPVIESDFVEWYGLYFSQSGELNNDRDSDGVVDGDELRTGRNPTIKEHFSISHEQGVFDLGLEVAGPFNVIEIVEYDSSTFKVRQTVSFRPSNTDNLVSFDTFEVEVSTDNSFVSLRIVPNPEYETGFFSYSFNP